MIEARWEQRAWAAGLFEGEGCITASNGRLVTRMTNADQSVLERFRDAVDAGTVYGAYQREPPRKPVYVWVGCEEVGLDVLALIGRWLSPRRVERAYELTGIRFDGL